MAELIDRKAFIEWFKDNYKTEQVDEDTGETTEYDIWISSVDVIDDIESFTPYTTEAEIIMDFLQFVSDNASDYFFNSGWAMSDLIDLEFKYLDQLKEE